VDWTQYINDLFIRSAFWNLSVTGHRLTDEEIGYPFYANRLIGIPRLRQLRVSDDTCTVHHALETYIDSCFGHFSDDTESVESFGNANVPGYATVDR